MQSFRLKITILSVLLSGIVLISLSAFLIWIDARNGKQRIDRELLAIAESQLGSRHPREYYENLNRSLQYVFPQKKLEEIRLKIVARNGRILFESKNWDPAFDEKHAHYAELIDEDMDPFPPPERREGPNHDPYDVSRPGQRPREDRRPPPRKNDRRRRPLPTLTEPVLETEHTEDGSWRMGLMANQYLIFAMGVDLKTFYDDSKKFRHSVYFASPAALVLLAIAGWFLSGRSLRPVGAIADTARNISAHDLQNRIEIDHADKEFSQLIDVINAMLERLERSFSQATRFSADAAHELKTPLTILQGKIHQGLSSAQDGSPEQQNYETLLEEIQRLRSIIGKLLLLSQADSGHLEISPSHFSLSRLLETMVEDIEIMAPDLRLLYEIQPDVEINADEDLMYQALQNLIQNAIKYNLAGGFIKLQLHASADEVQCIVSNSAKPIPPEKQSRIFDRFYRVTDSRNREIEGTGLGLSLTHEIIRAHHGRILLAKSDERETAFMIVLPKG